MLLVLLLQCKTSAQYFFQWHFCVFYQISLVCFSFQPLQIPNTDNNSLWILLSFLLLFKDHPTQQMWFCNTPPLETCLSFTQGHTSSTCSGHKIRTDFTRSWQSEKKKFLPLSSTVAVLITSLFAHPPILWPLTTPIWPHTLWLHSKWQVVNKPVSVKQEDYGAVLWYTIKTWKFKLRYR